MLLHEVAAGKLLLIVLPASCIISCVKPYYFRSAFRSTFLRSSFHSCPPSDVGADVADVIAQVCEFVSIHNNTIFTDQHTLVFHSNYSVL